MPAFEDNTVMPVFNTVLTTAITAPKTKILSEDKLGEDKLITVSPEVTDTAKIKQAPPLLKIPVRKRGSRSVKFSPATLNSPGSYYMKLEKYIAKVRKQKLLAQFLWLLNERPHFIMWNSLEKQALFEQSQNMDIVFTEHFNAIPEEVFKTLHKEYGFHVTKTIEDGINYWGVHHDKLVDPYEKAAIFSLLPSL